ATRRPPISSTSSNGSRGAISPRTAAISSRGPRVWTGRSFPPNPTRPTGIGASSTRGRAAPRSRTASRSASAAPARNRDAIAREGRGAHAQPARRRQVLRLDVLSGRALDSTPVGDRVSPDRRGPIAAGLAALSHGKLILLLALTTAAFGVSAAMPLTPTLRDS